jgi:hypothetical protein
MTIVKNIIIILGVSLVLILPSIFVFAAEVHEDTIEPYLHIKSPKNGYLYILDKSIIYRPLAQTTIFGKITIKLEVFDNESGINRVEIFIDDELKTTIIPPYYEWMWDDRAFSTHTIKVIAYDNVNNSATEELSVKIISFGRLPKAPDTPDVGIGTQHNTDAFNYYNYKDGVGDFVYNQLWYFNFLDDKGTSDPSDDIAGVAAYGLANPENLLSGGGVTNCFGMIIRDPSEGTSFPQFSQDWDPSVSGNFYASDTFEPGPGFEFENPGGTIDVISPDHYHLTGQALGSDREFRWDLHYQRTIGQQWLPWVEWPVPHTLGILPAWINYHMQMANAVVNGTFYVRDGAHEVMYELDGARGYHDGFFSEFVFSIFEWDWLDFKQDNLSVHLLHPHAPRYSCKDGWETCTPGNLRVVFDDESEVKEYNFYRGCDIDKQEIFISYGNWSVDPKYPDVMYPLDEKITAIDAEGNRLDLHWRLERYMIVYFDIPDPFFDTVTFEIIAEFTGTFYEVDSGKTIPIAGPGWADYSGPAFPEK